MPTRRHVLGNTVAVISATVLFSKPMLLLAAAETSEHRITIANFEFSTGVLTAKLGDKVIWVNSDTVPHTATAIDHSWNTGLIKPGESATIDVSANMMESYFCEYHPMMVAELNIER